MPDKNDALRPWLIAVWPGMGHVALSAGYYLMAKLGMHQMAEFSATGLFDVDFAMVREGVVQRSQRPRSRFFLWKAPEGQRDIIVFIGEAQPPLGKYAFCEKLIDFARDQGVERVVTFAAMATRMHPEQESRVFAAVTDRELLEETHSAQADPLQEGPIGGLNGVLLAAAADKGMPGLCLLGEMPHIFAQVPFPKASLAVLRTFVQLAGIEVDFTELKQQAKAIEQQLGDLLAQVEGSQTEGAAEGPPEETYQAPEAEGGLPEKDRERIEALFRSAKQDRAKAYELKNALDRLRVFRKYEDRFLDLFANDPPGE